MTPRAKMLSVRLDDSLEDAVSKMRTVMSYDDDAMSERACGDQRSFLTA